MLTACHSQNGRAFQSVSICVCTLDVHSSWDVVLFGLSFSDPNANPNKRQRQPALLGDHPPEYGQSNTPSNGLTSASCFIGAYGVYLIVFIFSRWSSGWLWSLWWHIWTTSPTPSLWGQAHGAPNGTWPWRGPVMVGRSTDKDLLRRTTMLMLTLLWSWCMVLSPPRSMQTEFSTYSVSSAMWRGWVGDGVLCLWKASLMLTKAAFVWSRIQ